MSIFAPIETLKYDMTKYDPVKIAVKDLNFELMYTTYFIPLCNYAKRFVNQEDKNIVQDAFEILLKKRESNLIIEKLSSYLFWIVKNNCLDYLKYDKVKRWHNEHIQTMHDNGDTSMTRDDNDPQFLLESKEREEEIKKSIEELPGAERKVIELWLEELSYQKISEILGKSINTVDVQIRRAKAKLRNSIENER